VDLINLQGFVFAGVSLGTPGVGLALILPLKVRSWSTDDPEKPTKLERGALYQDSQGKFGMLN